MFIFIFFYKVSCNFQWDGFMSLGHFMLDILCRTLSSTHALTFSKSVLSTSLPSTLSRKRRMTFQIKVYSVSLSIKILVLKNAPKAGVSRKNAEHLSSEMEWSGPSAFRLNSKWTCLFPLMQRQKNRLVRWSNSSTLCKRKRTVFGSKNLRRCAELSRHLSNPENHNNTKTELSRLL